MPTYRHAGLVFDFDDSGPRDAETIVLLHGFPETRRSWDAVTPGLVAAGYRVLAPDQRGYSPGARPRSRGAYRIHHLVDDVVALLDATGVERAHVVGHDWGGMVAWMLGAWHPGRTATVTSLATPHPKAFLRAVVQSNQLLKSWYMLMFQLPGLPERAMIGGVTSPFWRAMESSGLPRERCALYARHMRRPGAARGAVNWYRAMPLTPAWQLNDCAVPTLYLYATGDVALGRSAAELTSRYATGDYTFDVLEGVSHWIPEVVPDVVCERVIKHVRAHPAETGKATPRGRGVTAPAGRR